jgi:hypothetical protein
MPLSYRNLISGNKIKDALASMKLGEDSRTKIMKKQIISPKYIKGYESETFWESVFVGKKRNNLSDKNNGGEGSLFSDGTGILGSSDTERQSRFGQLFGFENKELDPYDPNTTDSAKLEEFWKKPGRVLIPTIDENTNTFRNILFPDTTWHYQGTGNTQKSGWADNSDQYEDPLKLGFEIFFDTNSPFFAGSDEDDQDYDLDNETVPFNSIKRFFQKYQKITEIFWRYLTWQEFRNKLFTIFEKDMINDKRSYSNKPYYINKIGGLENLVKKITKYGEDKLTITLNEDVRMISWYLSELYNNLVYSYKDKRNMIPENLLRFDMHIKIHDFRNFTMPEYVGNEIVYKPSPKSTIMFTLRDCSFNFSESVNFPSEITLAGIDAAQPTPSDLKFDIIYKSVTRWTNLPFFEQTFNPYETEPFWSDIDQKAFESLNIIKEDKPGITENKGFWNDRLTEATQTIANAGLDYLDNFSTKLREKRGEFVESSLNEFRNMVNINKIEPDNVYSKQFNNRLSLKNAGKSLANDLLTDFEGNARNITNF